jgi:predicted Zn-dependent peptidase
MFSEKHQDYIGLEVLSTALGGYFGSRLMKNIREEKGFTYGIGSFMNAWSQTGYFSIVAETGVEVTQKAINEIYKELHRISVTPLDEEELMIVKNYMIGSLMRMLEGVPGISNSFNQLIKNDLPFNHYQQMIEQINAINPGQLTELANTYLQKNTMYEIVAGKKEK